jgi:hypothetical protein
LITPLFHGKFRLWKGIDYRCFFVKSKRFFSSKQILEGFYDGKNGHDEQVNDDADEHDDDDGNGKDGLPNEMHEYDDGTNVGHGYDDGRHDDEQR